MASVVDDLPCVRLATHHYRAKRLNERSENQRGNRTHKHRGKNKRRNKMKTKTNCGRGCRPLRVLVVEPLPHGVSIGTYPYTQKNAHAHIHWCTPFYKKHRTVFQTLDRLLVMSNFSGTVSTKCRMFYENAQNL